MYKKVYTYKKGGKTMSENQKFIVSKIVNAIIVALGAIAAAIFGGN